MDINKILEAGLEFFGVYYGTYRAIIKDNNDPEKLGRLMIHCPQVHGPNFPPTWAWPIAHMGATKAGIWAIPDIGEWVYVQFDHGRPEYPLWGGGWWEKGGTTEDMVVTKVVVCTPEGMKVVIDRGSPPIGLLQPGNINLTGRPILHNPDGTISSEKSFSIGTDKGEVLIPLIVNGVELTQQQAIDNYTTTGENMGVFDTPEHADAYATQVHNRALTAAGEPVFVLPTGLSILVQQSQGNSVLITDDECAVKHQGKVSVTADEVEIISDGDTAVTAQGDISLSALGDLSLVSTGDVKVKGAGDMEVSTTGTLTVASAGKVSIKSDLNVDISSTAKITIEAPAAAINVPDLEITGNLKVTGTVDVEGNGHVTGSWSATTNSAHHTHLVVNGVAIQGA